MKRVNIIKLIGIIIFGAIGIWGLVYGASQIAKTSAFISDAAQVKAKVSKIKASIDSDGDTNYSAYVTYTYNEKEYKNIALREYNSSLYEGKAIDLYVDKDNPKNVRIKSVIYFFPVAYIVIGVVFLSIGIIILLLMIKDKRRRKKIIKTGVKIYAQVKGSVIDTSYTINEKHPYRLECVYYDEMSGQPVICTSDIIWEAPEKYIDKYVPVYVDRNDRSRYIVDLKNITDRQL